MKGYASHLWLVLASLGALGSQAQGDTPAATEDRDRIIHVLNRTTFGVRPGDVEAVQKIGLRAYLDQQLHPERIDDSVVTRELAGFNLLQLSQTELHQLYFAEFQTIVTDRQARIERQKQEGDTPLQPAAAAAPITPAPKGGRYAMVAANVPPGLVEENGNFRAAVSQLEHAKLIRAIDSPRQLQEVLVDFWGNHFNVDVKKKGPCSLYKITDDREVIRPHVLGSFRQLLEASAKSPAMLFYLDNFKNSSPLPDLEKPVAAASPTMAMTEMTPNAPAAPQGGKRARGINENYAREIMELHTLGVDGGYTQKDVQEVARCFTGWTINQMTGLFVFRKNLHDQGQKVVLGHTIPANGGMADGEMVLDILASQPACARFISRELCQRFVGDTPPPELVNRIAWTFTATKGDLRAVTEAILTSPEFLNPATYGNKIKSPLEFAVSAVRASGSTFVEARQFGPNDARRDVESLSILGKNRFVDQLTNRPQQSLNWHVYTLGQPLFACTPPTGYSEVSSTWVNPGALIERLNFALALTEQRISDVHFSAQNVIGQTDIDHPGALLDRCVDTLLQGHVSAATKAVLTQAALPTADAAQTVNPNKLIALIIGSPEFQRK